MPTFRSQRMPLRTNLGFFQLKGLQISIIVHRALGLKCSRVNKHFITHLHDLHVVTKITLFQSVVKILLLFQSHSFIKIPCYNKLLLKVLVVVWLRYLIRNQITSGSMEALDRILMIFFIIISVNANIFYLTYLRS